MKKLILIFVVCFILLLGLAGCNNDKKIEDNEPIYRLHAGCLTVHSDSGFYFNGKLQSYDKSFSSGVLIVYENYITVMSTDSIIKYHLSKEGTSWSAYNITYEKSYK